jgi:hypothetical protein
VIIPALRSVEIVGRDHPQTLAALCHHHGNQAAGIAFAVIDESEFSSNILLINGNRIV